MRSALTGSLVALAVFPLLVSSGVRKSDRTRQIIPHPPHPPAAARAPTLAARATCAVRRAAVQSLIEFYKQLGGPYWTNNDGWDPDGGADPCDPKARWYGVGCIDPCDIYRDGPSCAFGRITALTLRDNNISGPITNWTLVGELNNLTWIDLSVNDIHGSMPAEFGRIMNIEVLNMGYNKLSGQLPDTLGEINSNGAAHLHEFNFYDNRLQGTLPSSLAQLSAIRMLNLAHNNISGSIPPEWVNFSSLQAPRPRRDRGFGRSVTGVCPCDASPIVGAVRQ